MREQFPGAGKQEQARELPRLCRRASPLVTACDPRSPPFGRDPRGRRVHLGGSVPEHLILPFGQMRDHLVQDPDQIDKISGLDYYLISRSYVLPFV